jgi:hypothetical protein
VISKAAKGRNAGLLADVEVIAQPLPVRPRSSRPL